MAVTNIKTNSFSKILKKFQISLNQKLLIVVSTKTDELFLSTRNIKNIELIAASNLNTMSLIKAKQILITVKALDDIKEIYCG